MVICSFYHISGASFSHCQVWRAVNIVACETMHLVLVFSGEDFFSMDCFFFNCSLISEVDCE